MKAAPCGRWPSPRIRPRGSRPEKSPSFPEASTAFHLDGDLCGLLVVDGDRGLYGAKALLPDLQLVLARRQIVEGKGPVRTGDRIEGVRCHDHPRSHPRMQVAVDAHDLRLGEGDRDRA